MVIGEVQRVDTSGSKSSKSSGDTSDCTPPTGIERQKAEKRLVRKLDMRLLVPVVVIYIMNYIDRTAITSARLKGLEQDLKLTEVQYSVILAVFFAVYCPSQIPSNMVLNYISCPSWFISACVISWGLVSTLTGVTRNFSGILICRLFLGIPEAAFYPGSIYLLSRWYTRKELALRTAFLYGGLTISSAFGSLMAAGILSGMEGRLGIRAWRWLFYIEVCGVYKTETRLRRTRCKGRHNDVPGHSDAVSAAHPNLIFAHCQIRWILPDYPNNTQWLSPSERRLAQIRLAEDAGEADEDTHNDSAWKGLLSAIKDPKVLLFSFVAFFDLMGMGFVNFFPTLTATLGFSTTITLLLAAPPWIVASIICVVNGYHADRTGERFFHVTAFWWMSILGYVVALSTMSVVGRYIALFLLASGHTGFVMTFVWVSNSIPRPPAKRAASIGIVSGIGNLGNLVSSFLWKTEWGPRYAPSMIIGICSLVVAIFLSFVIRTLLVRANKQFELLEDDQWQQAPINEDRVREAARLEGLALEEALRRRRDFRYLY
ncbi:MFS general substrate transporter [Macrolepiota fuliginosa MF-IS2]|uniref:MFS general substrate transporter n=1 Tax=Macrolepiota fuliginosa MF-IS2 TaxID=1400762 RepID=A0A9P5XKP2_9AGAR|nr:MFS general substrate transporter [Macrolepiota fuliginosa MF-IS2]